MIDKKELMAEEKYLNIVIYTIDSALYFINNGIYKSEKELKEISEFISNSFYEMDAQEVAVQRNLLEKLQLDFVALTDSKNLLERQKQNAYFGRIDFKADDEKEQNSYYIGISHILKEGKAIPLVLDWRAPLSSMYYDFELGGASYLAPMGEIVGNISLKRQYKTQERQLVYAFDSDLTIGDDILKQTLGQNSDSKMKTIVATIQAEQNKIIRSDENVNLLVQGVAGSGKTSIALHRVAYLLYKNKISSKDILIVSPSSLFSDYINNVLPELGEQNTPKITFDEIAQNELNGYLEFEPKSKMLEDIVNGNFLRAEEIEYKSSFEFYENLKTFLEKFVGATFKATDIVVGEKIIKADIINDFYNERYKTKNPALRIEWIADYVVDQLDISNQNQKGVFARVKKVLFGMFENCNILDIYSMFLTAIGLKLKQYSSETSIFVGYEDVPAILFIKDYLIGVEVFKKYKHIIVDEMQDYSPIVFDLFKKIFPCPKTILGDIYQSFEKRLDHKYLNDLVLLLGDCKLLKLGTTYRSTYQIAQYNQNIINLQGVNNFKRQGESVEVYNKTENFFENVENCIKKMLEKFENVAIITTNVADSKLLYQKLNKNFEINLIDESCGEVNGKLNIIPAVFSKGLEFDCVIFINKTFATEKTYLSKNIKYISCTRALHKLAVFE